MQIQTVFLWTDILIFGLVIAVILFGLWARRSVPFVMAWRRVMQRNLALVSLLLLLVYVSIGLLDSIHFRQAVSTDASGHVQYSTSVKSLFDLMVSPLGQLQEKTYSAPFATHLFVKENIQQGNQVIRDYPALKLTQSLSGTKSADILLRLTKALVLTLLAMVILLSFFAYAQGKKHGLGVHEVWRKLLHNEFELNWRLIFCTGFVILLCFYSLALLAQQYHIFGTDKVGQDVFYQTLKSIRTGLVIGTLTTLIMLPFAIFLGISAGFFGGWVDDFIQYLYTTLSSIPGVLLIAAAVLSLQVYIANHADQYATLSHRADLRLFALCMILGVTSWTGLCRMLRGETLKLREIDYIQAANALGTRHFITLFRHILPNVMHIVLIAVVLDFSMLVLAEAVLSYVGVGVDPSSISWGNMINSARLELAREPVVWWPLLAAFIFMFVLVLAANLFSDAVRDGFDPRMKHH